MIPKEVFLSHSSVNRAVATVVAQTLRDHGIPVWFSSTNIRTAQLWQDEIGRALQRCDWFLVLVSTAAIESTWVKRELAYALSHSQYNDHIIPVMIENCDYEKLSWTLGVFQMANLNTSSEIAYRQMLQAWGVGLDIDLICQQ
jgi:hypothetical protein